MPPATCQPPPPTYETTYKLSATPSVIVAGAPGTSSWKVPAII